MKKIHMIAALLAMLMPITQVWAGGSNTYYAKISAEVTAGSPTGAGTVYAGSTEATSSSNYQATSAATGSAGVSWSWGGSDPGKATVTMYLSAKAAYGYVFDGWYRNNEATGTAVSTKASDTISVNSTSANKNSPTDGGTYFAKFIENTDGYAVSLVAPEGLSSYTVTGPTGFNGSGLSHGGDMTAYKGDSFTFKATVADGYEFVKWTVNGADAGTSTTLTKSFTAASTVQAVVNKLVTYYATCQAVPAGCSYKVGSMVVSSSEYQTSGYGTLTVNLSAPTAASGYMFAGWYEIVDGNKTIISTDASTTVTKKSDVTLGADFVAITAPVMLVTSSGIVDYDDFDAAFAAAKSGDKLKVVGNGTLTTDAYVNPGVTLDVAAGVTLTVASGATLYIDGSATVNGAIAGTVSRCTKLIQQTGDGTVNAETGKPNPFNPYGSAKYWKTSTSTPSIPSISGAGSHTTIVNGYGEAFRTTEVTSSSTFIFVNVDTSKAVNHITGIKSVSTVKNILTATISGGMAVLVSSSCVINGGTSSKTTFAGRIDAAGQTLVSVTGVEVSNGGASYLLNCPSFSMKKSVNNNFSFYNCDSVSFSTFNAKTANLSFYDCGTFANPASCSFSYAASPTADAKFSFYSGYYKTLTFPSVAKVYGGSYKKTPESYLADVDTLEVVYESDSKYYVVQEKKQVTYLVSIGTAQYETLAEAISAAKSGDTIALIERVDLTGTTLTVPADKNITIALDKHSIVGGKIVNNGTLVFTDSTIYSDGSVSSEIENAGNNAKLDFVFGTYSGAIANTAGTLTVHNGVFTGAFTQGGGTVNLKGGHFTANVSDLVTNDGYAVVMSDGKYCVCERPDGTMKSVTVENVPGYSATPYSTSNPNEYTLLKNARGGAKTRNDYSMSDWMRIAELLTFYEVFHNSGMDPTLVFDRNVAQNSLNLGTTPSSYGMAQIKFDVVAGKPYRALTENLTAAAKTWQAIFDDNISSVAVSVSDKSGNNKGTLCKAMIEVWESQKVGSTRVTNTVFVVGQKVFTIDAGSNKAMIRPETGAATFYQNLSGENSAVAAAITGSNKKIMLANDCSQNLALTSPGTYTFDTMGFAYTGGEPTVSDGLFVKSETAVDSSAKVLVPDAKATTYVVAQKVASAGGTFYDNLTEAVGAANGAVVTLLAATDETVALGQGQSLKLAIANGVSYDAVSKIVVDSSLTGYGIKATADDGYTLYEVVQSAVSSGGSDYASVEEAISDASGDTVEVTVTADITEEVSLDAGKTLSVTVNDGVEANVTVNPVAGAFIDATTDGNTTIYESKKITVEMATPQVTVAVTKIENGEETTVSDPATITAAVNALMSNVDVPRTDNTDKLKVLDNITVTPTKIVEEVVDSKTIIRSATFDVTPAYNVGQSLAEGQTLKFRLPVDAAATQSKAIVYHGDARFGMYTVQTENDAKFIEVESSEFSPYGYELLNAFSYNDFVEALYTNNGSFNGNAAAYAGYDKDAEGRLIVLIEPNGGNWTSGSCTAEWATPYRNNGGIAQLQLFHSMVDARKGKTTTGVTDVSVQNVAFVVAGTGSGSVTGGYNSFDLSSVDAYQLYLMNNGDVTFDNCGFDGVGLAVFPPEAYAAGNVAGGYTATDNTTIIKDCSFANIYDYAIKEVNTPNYYVTDTSFENCGCAMLIHPLNQGDAGTAAFVGNTFKNVDNGSPWSDKAAGGAGTVKFDVRNAGTTLIWGNNTVENCSGVADTEYHFRNVSGNVVTELKTAMDDTHTISYVSGGVNFNTVALGQVSVNGDGTASWVAPVAKIGTTYYWTLAAAVGAASDGDVITILAGGTFEEVVGQATQFTINKSVTIDFNGKTVTAIPNSGFNVEAGGTVLSNGTLRVVSGSSYVVRVNGAEDVVVDSLNTYGGVNANNSTVTLANNDIHSAMYYSICSQGGSVVTVNSGTYHRVDADGTNYEGANLIYCSSGSKVYVKGGTYDNSNNYQTYNYFAANVADVKITGGTFFFNPTDHFGVRSAWVTDNGNGTWTVVAPDPVAMIGDTPYYSLEEAVAFADGWDPIVMLTDIDLGSDVLTLDKMVTLYGAEDGETPHTLTGTVKVSAAADPEEYVQVEIVNLVFGTGSTIDVSDRGDGDEVYFTLTDVTAEAPITVVAGDLDGRKTLIDDVGDLTATDFTATLTSGYELYLTFGALQAVKWVASVNGMKFEDLADAIDVADLLDANEITILDGTTVSPNADWKVVDGKLVRKVYVAQIVTNEGATTNKYESLAEAVDAAASGATIEMIADDRVSLAGATDDKEIIIEKSLTITGAVNEDGSPKYTIFGTPTYGKGGEYNDIFIRGLTPINVTIQNVNIRDFGSQVASYASNAVLYMSGSTVPEANLVVSNVTISAYNAYAIIAAQGNLKVVDCFIDGFKDSSVASVLTGGIWTGDMYDEYEATATILRTTIINTSSATQWGAYAIDARPSSTVTVTDCTLTNVANGIAAIATQNAGVGEVSVAVSGTVVEAVHNALAISGNPDEVSSKVVYIASVEVSSGRFIGDVAIPSQFEEVGLIEISGGIYSDDPSAYVVEGYAAVALTEGDEGYDAGYRYAVGKIAASDLVPAAGATEKEATYNFNVVVTNGTEVLKTVTGQHITVCVDDANSIADITLNDFNMANILASAVSVVGTGNENVTVDLRVRAVSQSGGKVVFEAHPEAVITVGGAEPTIVALSNDDLADGATFSLKFYTETFAAGTLVKITHKSAGYENEVFIVAVAEDATGRYVPVTVSHFSTFEIEAFTPDAGMVAVNCNTGVQYDSLATAVSEASSGATIAMLDNVALAGTVTIDKAIVLDLNGKTISAASVTPTFSVPASGSLTVDESSVSASGCIKNTAANGVAIYCDAGSVTVNNGTVGSPDTYRGVVVDHVGTVTVNDGSVIASNAAIRSTATAHDVITINGGTIGAATTDYAVYDYDYATIAIHGGVLNADKIAIAAFGSNLTIDGGEINKYGNTEYAILLGEAGTATISAGTINSAYTGIFVGDNGTTLNITGGTITGVANDGVISLNGSKKQTATINISGGTVVNTGTGAAIYQPAGGTTVNVSGDAVLTGPTGIILKGGTLNVSGGTISGTGPYTAPAAASSGGTSTGDAVYVEDVYGPGDYNVNYAPTVNITGGTLTSVNGYAAQYFTEETASSTYKANGSIAVSGDATLTSDKQTDAMASTVIPDKVLVSGGSFAHEVPEELCADGYIPAAQDPVTHRYTVKVGAYVAQIGTTKYESLEAAVTAASAGDTVTLLADVDLSSHARSASDDIVLADITLDLNGKTIRGFNSGVRYSGSNAVIKNGTFDFVAAEAKPNYALSIGSYADGAAKSTGMRLENLTVKGGINIDNADVTLTDVTIDQEAGTFYCLYVDEDNNASATFVSGTINAGANATAVFGVAKAGTGTTDGTLNVQGGTVNARGEKLVLASGNHIQVSGGSFDVAVPEADCATGYIPSTETTVVDNVTYYTVKTGSYVAQIGTTKYESLEAAVAAANAEDTVQLLTDVELDEAVDIAESITLDLNGKTVSISEANEDGYAISVSSGTVTITGNGAIDAGDYIALDVAGGSVTIANGTFSVIGVDDGSLTITDGTFNGGLLTVDGTTIINGGTFNDVVDVGGGAVIINNGAFTAADNVLMVTDAEGTLTVNGGTFAATPSGEGDPIVVYVEGGEANLTGGTFTGGTIATDEAETGTLTVSGGFFSALVPEEYCANGYIPTAQNSETGLYSVTQGSYYDVWVGGTQLSSVNAADVFGDGKVSYDDATKTLALNGYTYSGAGYGSSAVYIGDMGGATFNVVVADENSLTSTAAYGYAIRSVGTGAVTVTGSGSDPSLALTVPSADDTGYAVSVKGTSATFKDLSMAVTGYLGIVVNGNNAAGDALTIDNCDITFAGTAMDQAVYVQNREAGEATLRIVGSALTGAGSLLVHGENSSGCDADVWIEDSEINLTGAYDDSRHGIEVYSSYGDATLVITNCNSVTIASENAEADAVSVIAANKIGDKGSARLDIVGCNSVSLASDSQSGVTVATWDDTNATGEEATINILRSTVEIVGDGAYGLQTYGYGAGETHVSIIDSEVDVSANWMAIQLGAEQRFSANVGEITYAQTNSEVYAFSLETYGLTLTTLSTGRVNTDASVKAIISGGLFDSTGAVVVQCDDPTNAELVMTDGAEVNIDSSTATETEEDAILTGGKLTIDSGKYSFSYPDGLSAATNTVVGNITGGIFTEDVSDLCAEGYIAVDNTDAETKDAYPYMVRAAEYVAQIVRGDEVIAKYESFDEALDAAESGDTIQLLTDVTGPFELGKSASITLDLNGKTLSVESGNAISVTAGELTVTSAVDEDGYATGGISGVISVSDGAALHIEGGIYDLDWDDCNIVGAISVSSVNRFYESDPTEVEAASAVFTSPVPYEYCSTGFIPGAYDDIYIDGEFYYYVKEGTFLWKITDADGKVAYSEEVPYADDDEEWWEYDWFGEHEMNRNGFTMTLLHDVSADDDDFSAYVSGLTYTVDLGGHTVSQQMGFGAGECHVTITNGVVSNAGGTAISIANGAQVTLGDGLVISQSTTGVNVEGGTEAGAYSKLTVTDGATINGTYGVLVFGSGSENPVTEVVVEGGMITGTTYGISGNGTIEGDVDYSNTRITISGGTVTGGIAGIYHPQAGALNMSSGTVSGGMAIYAKSGTISVTGGELSANGASGQYDQSYAGSGPQQTGDALALDSVNYPGGNPTATISGGTFSSVNGEGVASYAATGETAESGFVSGGIFSSEVPEEYCADGYIPREGVIVTIDNVDYYTVKTGAYVAQIVRGGSVLAKYETFTNALEVAESGDTIQLLADVTGVTTTYDIEKTLTIDGQGQYKIVAGPNPEPRNVISAWSGPRVMFDMTRSTANVTFKDITLDNGEGHYYSFLARVKSGTTTLDNVTLLNGGEADASGTDGVGYGAAVQVDGGTVIVNGDFYADSHGEAGNENGGIFPFTAILYQTGVVHFNDGVSADIGKDLLLVGMEGAVDVSTDAGREMVNEMLEAMNVPAGYYPYTLKLGDSAMTSFTGASPLGWNGIIDYGTDIMNAANTSMGMDLNPDTTPVEVGLLADTVLPETFTYEDSNLTINGNGNAISGTIEYTDDAGTMENIVMGTDDKPLVLDMTGLSEGNAINLGSSIAASNVTIKVTEEQATTLGQAIVTWNAEGESEEDAASLESGIKVEIVDATTGQPVEDPVTGDPMEAAIIWDAEMGVAYIGPCEARLSGPTHESPIYTSLASAIARAANSGDTVTLLTNIVNYTGTQEISKSLTLDGAGHTISAAPVATHRDVVHAWAGSTSMFKLETGNITIKNIELDGDATHAYTFLISADNSSVNLTTENIRLLNGGELCGDANGDVVEPGAGYGAAIHLNNGAHLTVKDGFYADTHGAPAEPGQTVGMSDGVFPFTGILPEGGSSVLFDLTEDTNAEPTVEIGKDLLLVGMVGAIDSETAQGILDYMKVPSRFRPYTLTLGDGSAYAFTGASLLGWNEIIEYGKEIMDVSTAVGYEGLDKDDTPVEVGLLTDTVLPDKFVYEDSNFTVNGNGNALSGTIKYTDEAGVIENIVLGTEEAPLVLDLRNVTDPVEIGSLISVSNVTVLMTEEQAQLGQPVFTWNTETAQEPENSEAIKITVMPDAQSEPQGDEPEKDLVWDDELGIAYIGPCEARLTGPGKDPGYMDLTNAFKYAVSGDTITLFWSNVTLNASVALPAGNLLFTTNKYELTLGESAAFTITNATSVFRTELDALDCIALDGDCASGYLIRYATEAGVNVYNTTPLGEYIVAGKKADGSAGTANIKVSNEWVGDHICPIEEIRTANVVEDYLNSVDGTTGLRKWEGYVLKQAGPFIITAVDAASDAVTTTLGDPELQETTGFSVKYSLDEFNADGTVKTPGAQTSVRSFTLPVTSVLNYAYYRVRAHLTSGNETLVVDSANEIGVMAVTSALETTIVAVPWVEMDGEDVSVADHMRTATLTPGDTLQVYDSTAGAYVAWELDDNREWKPTTTVTSSGDLTPDDADAYTVPRGAGVWLTRQDTSKPIYLVGGATSEHVLTPLAAAEGGKPSWNIVAAPSVTPTSVSELMSGKPTSDQVVVPTAGAPKNFVYVSGKGWGYYSTEPVIKNGRQVGVKSVFKTNDATIPAGTGFFYLNSGSASTIEW